MKTLAKSLVVTFAFFGAFEVLAVDEIQGLGGNAERVMLKMNREFIGGEVQVFSSTRTLLISQKMTKRKVSIDFSGVRVGEYTVRIRKGTQQQEYYFLKK